MDQYELVISVAQYIETHPKQTASQIISELKIRNLEFSIADDMLTDLGAIKKPWGRTKDGGGNLYELCDTYNMKKIEPLVRKLLSGKK